MTKIEKFWYFYDLYVSSKDENYIKILSVILKHIEKTGNSLEFGKEWTKEKITFTTNLLGRLRKNS